MKIKVPGWQARRAAGTVGLALSVLASAAFAQQQLPDFQTSTTLTPQYQAAPDAGPNYQEAPQRSARGLFLATVLSVVAQGIGSSISQGLSGTITRWFGGKDTESTGVQQAAATVQEASTTPAQPADQALYAGVAYEVHAQAPDGSATAVDPASHVFRTGDRFVVFYRPNLPGRVDLSNTNAKGVETRIDSLEVAGGQLVTLGPYEFADDPGDEVLKISLSPCSSDRLLATTRTIVKSPSPARRTEALAQGTSDATLRLPSCGSPAATRSMQSTRRDIKKVIREGSTNFALDSIESREIAGGALAPRQVSIQMLHR